MKPILTITGSDPTGGSGMQADVKTIADLGGHAMSAITSIAVVALVVAAAPLLGRVGGVLLVRRDLRLIRALELGTLDDLDVGPDLRGNPLGVV